MNSMGWLGLLALLSRSLSLAGTAHGTAGGGHIPAGAFTTSGTVTSDIVLTDAGKVAAGNAVTVNLLGLQHDFAGDLRITLSYIDSNGATVQSVDVLNRIGATAANPYGSAADFGDGQGSGDNYQFNTDYSGDIWATAACSNPPACTTPYGDADPIPGVSTDTIYNGQYFSSTTGGAKTNLSYAFSGLNVSGTWRLTITDAADPRAGSYIGWEILVTTVSQPVIQTIAAVAGTPQSATVGTAFAAALQAKVSDSLSSPVAGVTVTFAAPTGGASATLGGASSAAAVTNSAGIATSPAPVANTVSGSYTITASVAGLTPASFNLTNTTAVAANSAVFQKTDTTTAGNWKGVYGTDGSLIPNDSSHVPGYATVNFSNALTYTWLGSTADSRALLKYSSSTDRIASTYYNSPTFTIDVNLTDGQTHQLALYLEDWDSGGRGETISFTDANTSAIFDTRSAAGFVAGRYLVWQVKGHVLIQFVRQAGYNAIVNGLFFDPAAGSTVNPPSVSITAPAAGATVSGVVSVSAQAQSTVGISSVQFLLDGNALGSPVTGAGPYSTSWASTGAANGSHTLAAIATDTQGHSSTSASVGVTLSNGASSSTSAAFQKVDTTTIGNWKGVYGGEGSLIPNDSSHIPGYATVNFTNALSYSWVPSITDSRALLKYASTTDRIASTYYNFPGFIIDVNLSDGQPHQVALYLDDWDSGNRGETIDILDAATNSVLDSRSASAFAVSGRYLVWTIQGHVLIKLTQQTGYNAVVNGIFFDASAGGSTPPTVALTAPAAGTTVSGSVTVIAQAQSTVGIASVQFMLDGNPLGPPVTGGGPTHSTTWVSGAAANGSHTLAAIATDSQGHSTTSTSVGVTVSNGSSVGVSVTFQKVDTATRGNWKGVYGADGSVIPNDSSHVPGYAAVNVNNALLYTWGASTADGRALLKYASATDRLASTYYSFSNFTIDVNFTDGLSHQVALYLLDWDSGNRAESISIVDAATNAALDTRSAASFTAGRYLVWNVQGHVLIQMTLQGGSNALVNGIFFDPAH
jgi:subtilisin-like proprotein convertase family protein